MVADAGLTLLDLSSTFDEIEDRESLVLASWDGHTNAAGHRLLADKLYAELVPHLFQVKSSAPPETSSAP